MFAIEEQMPSYLALAWEAYWDPEYIFYAPDERSYMLAIWLMV